MISRIIFCTAVLLATLSVIFLALLSPQYHTNNNTTSWVALSFYIQQPQPSGLDLPRMAQPNAGALIFHRNLTKGPENTSRVVGEVQGFIIPVESFAHSAFNIIYLTFHTHEYSGSVSVRAKNLAHKQKENLHVLGGTGSFAFACGHAVFKQRDKLESDLEATYNIKLHLRFPNKSQIIPG